MSYSKLRLSKRNRVYSNCRAGVIYLKLRLINVGTRRAVSAVRAQAIYLNGVPCPPPHPKLTKKALSPLQGGRVECSASGAERRGSFYIHTTSSLPLERVPQRGIMRKKRGNLTSTIIRTAEVISNVGLGI